MLYFVAANDTASPRWSLSHFVLVGVLALYAGVLMYAAAEMAPTVDEPAHIAAGLYTWRSGECRLYNVNPPLTKLVAAVPVLLAGAQEDWRHVRQPPARAEGRVGNDFINANGPRIFWLVTLARWACLPFPLLGAYVCFRWGREMFGPASGWLALLLWCGCPTILGHGALVTADVPAASVGVLAGYSFWRWLQAPSADKALLNGLMLGLCWLVKLTWVILPGIWVCLWLIHWLLSATPPARVQREAWHLAVSVLVGVLVLNIGYGFEGSLTPLRDFRFHSSLLTGLPARSPAPVEGNRFRDSWIGGVPLPLPSSFLYGLDAQRQDFEEPHDLYFAGERSKEGWRHFYIVAFFIKEPIGFLALCCGATWLRFSGHPPGARWRDKCLRVAPLWLPPAVLLLLVSAHPRLNYYRYAIPALPYVLIWAGSTGELLSPRRSLATSLVVLAATGSLISGVCSVPYSLSYVNMCGGGTMQGDAWFVDCNYDWGQDLFQLQQWQRDHPDARPLAVSYFGSCNPALAGIELIDPPSSLMDGTDRPKTYRIPPGWYALSATVVHTTARHVHSARPGYSPVTNGGLEPFESQVPVARAGPSILIFHIQ